MGFKLTTLVVIGTNCIGSCKSNYHTITTTEARSVFGRKGREQVTEYKINNADVVLRDDSTADDLVDVVEGNRVFLPCIYLLNKIDQISIEVCL
jgi:ribosome-interacting GTPase 1